MKESTELTKAKKAGLKVVSKEPAKGSKVQRFIALTEGNVVELDNVYRTLSIVPKRPTNKKLAKRYDAARKRLKNKGLL